jgi:hypothetical protein
MLDFFLAECFMQIEVIYLVTLEWLRDLVQIENPSCLRLEVHPQADHGSKIYFEL